MRSAGGGGSPQLRRAAAARRQTAARPASAASAQVRRGRACNCARRGREATSPGLAIDAGSVPPLDKEKGIDIGGRAGEPVLASADGKVVYAGAGLRGYGNLIILKHNNTFLTAYAHNQTLLVREDQTVRKGQKIAEMGSTDTDRVKLHFEIRRQGKPVDPARYLPPR